MFTRLYNILAMNPFISNTKRANLIGSIVGRIGDNCQIFKKVNLGSEPYLIEFGDNVKVTYGVRFITHDGGVHVLRNLGLIKNSDSIFGKIVIGNNVFIGNEAMILPGVNIGDNVIVGARSIVTKSIPENSIVAGAPAKKVSDIYLFHERNNGKFINIGDIGYSKKKELINSLRIEDFINK